MHLEVDVYHHFRVNPLDDLFKELEARIMSAFADHLAQLSAAVDAAEARVRGDLSALNDRIAALETKVAQGAASPEEIAALDELKGRVDKIDAAAATPAAAARGRKANPNPKPA